MAQLTIVEGDDGVTFSVRVSPRAKKTALLGVHDGALKLSLTAPPVDGVANAALIEFLAKALAVPRSAVQIQSGHTARLKRVRVLGVDSASIKGLVR